MNGEKNQMAEIIMPKGTAAWLIDNTTLTFKQIADFCALHELEVENMRNDIPAVDPIVNGQLTLEEIERCLQDENAVLQKKVIQQEAILKKPQKIKPYVPIAKREHVLHCIYWLIKRLPQLSDADIINLLGTTATTINAIRNRTHPNMANITPQSPVVVELCTQEQLDALIEKAAAKEENKKEENKEEKVS